MEYELRLTANLRKHLLQDAISPLEQDGLLDPDHDEYRESLEEVAEQLKDPRSYGRSWKIELSPAGAAELIRQIVGVTGIWETRQAGTNPRWSDSHELSRAAKARGAVRAGRRVIRELSEWLEEEVGAEVEWTMGTPKIRLPKEVT